MSAAGGTHLVSDIFRSPREFLANLDLHEVAAPVYVQYSIHCHIVTT